VADLEESPSHAHAVMTRLHEIVDTALPVSDAFAFISDFANAPVWDPGTVASERVDRGPVGIGARYRLQVRMGSRQAPMEYRIVGLEPGRHVVLEGEGSNVRARDEITFAALPGGGTRVDYTADLHLTGWMRLLTPFLGGTFAKIGDDARRGMQRALDERAAAHGGAR
jgi:hypothetical protein